MANKEFPRPATGSPYQGEPSSGAKPQYLTVTEVTAVVNYTLEDLFPQLLFRGEVSEFKLGPTGHLYFTIKDEGAQLSCVMWAVSVKRLGFKMKVGVKVRCHATPKIYPNQGRFQMMVQSLFEDGEGELRRRYIELHNRLEREGFFAKARKRKLPMLPRAVGIVTSRTGAVIHDIMVKIRERFPAMVVYLVDARVQGDGAALEIARAIERLDRSGLVDVTIVARGGGSLEDLWAFNEEPVVKAVFMSSVPVVSGVGHEVDTTLCDMAADVRAPTPTAAAELVVPKLADLNYAINNLERRLLDTDRWLHRRGQRLDELAFRLRARIDSVRSEAKLRLGSAEKLLAQIRPTKVIRSMGERVDWLEGRLVGFSKRILSERKERLVVIERRLKRGLNIGDLERRELLLTSLSKRLHVAIGRSLAIASERVEGAALRLNGVNPEGVLARGYAIVFSSGRVVRSVNDVSKGDLIKVRVADGEISGEVLD